MACLPSLMLLAATVGLLPGSGALDNGLALTPPMGWLVWERYACSVDCDAEPNSCINEELFMAMADRLAGDGFKELGYEYINIDDCWASKQRDAKGMLQADPVRFPHGIKYLADYVHAKGLKLGIYGDMGTTTCAGYPGAEGHVLQDAKTYAEWGVDMLKLDGCNADATVYASGYPNMSLALNSTGRPILFSCSWPDYISQPNYYLIANYCNIWRNYKDIKDSWSSVLDIITHYASVQDQIQPFAGPGQWNDPDMLVIGDFGLSLDEQRAQMALWAIFAAPLLMSNDLRNLPPESKLILQNKEVIAVNQDRLGVQGRLVSSVKNRNSGNSMVFGKMLEGADVAVALLNTGYFASPTNITVKFASVDFSSLSAGVRDLFAGQDLGTFTNEFTALVNPSGVGMFRLTPIS